MRFALFILLSTLPVISFAQNLGNEIKCSGYMGTYEETINGEPLNRSNDLWPIDLRFPKSDLQNDYILTWPIQDWDQKLTVYCNEEKRCVSDISQTYFETNQYHSISLMEINPESKDLHGNFQYRISSKGATFEITLDLGKPDDKSLLIREFAEFGAFSCPEELPKKFIKQLTR